MTSRATAPTPKRARLTWFVLGHATGLVAWSATDRLLAGSRARRYEADMRQVALEGSRRPAEQLDAEALPSMPVVDARSGAETTLAAAGERTPFVNLRATWCDPCKRELPSIERLASLRADVGFYLLSKEPHDTVAGFAGDGYPGLDFSSHDDAGTCLEGVADEAVPRTWILHDGRVTADHVGAAPWDSQEVLELLAGLGGD